MKKLFALLLCVVLVLSCTACANDTATTPSTQSSTTSSTPKDTEPSTPTQTTDPEPKPEPIVITDPSNGTALAVDLTSVGVIEKKAPSMTSASFMLEELTLQLPFVPSELAPFGWNEPFGMDEAQFVDAEATLPLANFELCDDDYNAITLLTARNDSDTEQSILDCQITSFSMSQNSITDTFGGFSLPGGIGFKSTAVNVVNVYGMPQDNANFERVEVGANYIRYINQTDSGLSYTFAFDSTGLIQKITVSLD